MYCPSCGSLNEDNSKFCVNCSAKLTEEVHVDPTENINANSQNPINDGNNVNSSDVPTFSPGHSIFLIIFSILCCGGIIGAIFAILSLTEGNKVKDYVAMGNLEMARQAKANSNKWIKATYITWAVVAVLMILYFVFVFGITIMNSAVIY